MKAGKTTKRITAAAAAISLLFLVLYALGIRPYIVLSGSMEPSISTGSIVLVDTLHRNPKINDVITYQIGSNRVTHRMIRKEDGNYITKGDANSTEDLIPVQKQQVNGIVIFHIPLAGYVLMFFRNHMSLFFVLMFSVKIVHALCRLSAGKAESFPEKPFTIQRKDDSVR